MTGPQARLLARAYGMDAGTAFMVGVMAEDAVNALQRAQEWMIMGNIPQEEGDAETQP